MSKPALDYDPTTDTLVVQLRPWPSPAPGHDPARAGIETAGPDLLIHYAPDGGAFAYEIARASEHPEHLAAALRARRAAALGWPGEA